MNAQEAIAEYALLIASIDRQLKVMDKALPLGTNGRAESIHDLLDERIRLKQRQDGLRLMHGIGEFVQ